MKNNNIDNKDCDRIQRNWMANDSSETHETAQILVEQNANRMTGENVC